MADEGSRPVPDPTILTTAQLDREIGHLKEIVAANDRLYVDMYHAHRRESDARFADIGKAVDRAEMAVHLANDKAEATVNQRFDSNDARLKNILESNDARLRTIDDHTAQCVPRIEYDSRHQALLETIEANRKFATEKIDAVEKAVTELVAMARGQRAVGNLLFAALGAVGVLAAIIFGVIAVIR